MLFGVNCKQSDCNGWLFSAQETRTSFRNLYVVWNSFSVIQSLVLCALLILCDTLCGDLCEWKWGLINHKCDHLPSCNAYVRYVGIFFGKVCRACPMSLYRPLVLFTIVSFLYRISLYAGVNEWRKEDWTVTEIMRTYFIRKDFKEPTFSPRIMKSSANRIPLNCIVILW